METMAFIRYSGSHTSAEPTRQAFPSAFRIVVSNASRRFSEFTCVTFISTLTIESTKTGRLNAEFCKIYTAPSPGKSTPSAFEINPPKNAP